MLDTINLGIVNYVLSHHCGCVIKALLQVTGVSFAASG